MATQPKGRRQLIVEFVTLYNKAQEYLKKISPNDRNEPINEDLLTTAPNVTALQLEEANNAVVSLKVVHKAVSIEELLRHRIERDFRIDEAIPTPDQIEETNRPELIALYSVFSYISPAINYQGYNYSAQEYYDENTYLEYISYKTNRLQTFEQGISEDIRAQSWELIAEDLGAVDDTEEDDRPNGAGRPTAPNILVQLAERATNAEGIERLRLFLALIGRARKGLINISPNAISWNVGTATDAYKHKHVKYFIEKASEVFQLKKNKAVQWEAWGRFIGGADNLKKIANPNEEQKEKINEFFSSLNEDKTTSSPKLSIRTKAQ